MEPITRRYDFVLYFDVQDGNPNGDPDAGNLPRIDAETGIGLVTDVCLKRKVRNYILQTKGNQPPHEIYVKEKAILNEQHKRAYQAIGAGEMVEKKEAKKRTGGDVVEEARQWMCQTFYDIRAFGAVMTTGINCGQVRGPIQMTFARSVEPIVALEHSITRMAVTTEEEAAKQQGDNRTMGRKYTVPYGLYRAYGFVSPFLAQQTGFSADDLELFWQALEQMFEHDRSAARGLMSTRALVIFEHKSPLGSRPAHELFQRVAHRRRSDGPTRSFDDYELLLDGNPIQASPRLVVPVD
ncbi:MAG: type I-C CRISPR-associated protein Cas7/Csd2 [Candidatus Kapaibacterium sp.]|nr:MAG: type I-C CRISPR-associated protein Cas7/Csd2 [Candidatus Kapabacteria bacterium]